MGEKSKRELLRHSLATLAYRGGKAIANAPKDFATMKASETTRTPVEILAHIGDLMDWALWMAREKPVWKDSEPCLGKKNRSVGRTHLNYLSAKYAQSQITQALLVNS